MHSMSKLNESDPHDTFAIPPETVPVAWADKVLADITKDSRSAAADRPPAAASAAAPAVDTTFRATAVGDLRVANDTAAEPRPIGKWTKGAVMLVLTLCSAAAAAGWQQYGGAARQMISHWTPAFALSASPTDSTGPDEQPVAAAVQAAAADPAPQVTAPAPPTESAALPATAPASDATQLQSMARDLAAMAQQLAELKASIAELRASQQAMAVAKPVRGKTLRGQAFSSKSQAKDIAAATSGRGAAAPADAGLCARASRRTAADAAGSSACRLMAACAAPATSGDRAGWRAGGAAADAVALASSTGDRVGRLLPMLRDARVARSSA